MKSIIILTDDDICTVGKEKTIKYISVYDFIFPINHEANIIMYSGIKGQRVFKCRNQNEFTEQIINNLLNAYLDKI